MKVIPGLALLAFLFGISSSALGQAELVSQPDYATKTTGIGTNSKNASGATPEGTPDEEKRTDESDDTLYRGKTDEMEATLLRDDGMRHFKTRPKEKTQQIDSLKNLQSSGTDPKFQGNFAISGVSSIDTIVAKQDEETGDAAEPDKDQADSRFARKHLTFKPQADDKPKKTEAESSPSPTPTPTPSPAAKNSSDSKE